MSNLLRQMPPDPATVAAARRGCDRRRLPTRCGERPCRRSHRCSAPWRRDPIGSYTLPPCLIAAYKAGVERVCDGEEAMEEVMLVAAEAMNLPNPVLAVEFDTADLED
ncbi:MAG TPA: hypothetical protein VIL09_04305 [Microvirga sp.]|jgi:hypothetical protein